jgi:pyridoxine 5'-phosphate synthase PdxJ
LQTVQFILDNSAKMRFRVRASTFGQTEKYMMAAGTITRCMVMEIFRGLMANTTSANFKKTSDMGKVNSLGKMAESTKDNGIKENKMV